MANELNEKQKLFCKYYVSEEFFGNGVKAYAKAYGIDIDDPRKYASARTRAGELLSKVDICNTINEELDEAGLTDNFVDKQLLFVITQHSDLHAKMKAIEQYNKLKQRITDKSETKVSGEWEITLKL
jgi:phage terminase small subunit